MSAAAGPHAAAPAREGATEPVLRDTRAVWIAWSLAIGVLFLARPGADRFDKPILVYWLQAASVAVLGASEAAVRLPSALCAWAWCLSAAAFARPRFGATGRTSSARAAR